MHWQLPSGIRKLYEVHTVNRQQMSGVHKLREFMIDTPEFRVAGELQRLAQFGEHFAVISAWA